MGLGVRKERDGYAVFDGREALVRGLREKRDAHKICYDVQRKGFFRGAVTFARSGKVFEITVPTGVDFSIGEAEAEPPMWPPKEERTRDGFGRFTSQRDDEGSVDDL